MRRIRLSGRNSKPALVLLICAVTAVLTGAAAFLTQYAAVNFFEWTPTVVRETRELDPRDIITINSADMAMEVYVHRGGQVIIDYVGETELLTYQGDFELRIYREEDFTLSLFSRDKFKYKMRVGLPERLYAELNLTSASGNIHVENLKAEALNITSRSGNVALLEAEGLITVSTRYGDVYTQFGNLTDECLIETDTGSVAVYMPARHNVNLEYFTESGILTSDFPYTSDETHIRFTVSTISGSLNFHELIQYIG